MYSQGREPLGDSRKDNSPWATCSPLEELAGPLVGVCPRDTLARAPQESCSAMLTASSIRKRENWRRPKHPRTSSGHRNCWIRTMGRSTAVTSGEPLASTRKQHHAGQTKRAAVRGSKEESAVPLPVPATGRQVSPSSHSHSTHASPAARLPFCTKKLQLCASRSRQSRWPLEQTGPCSGWRLPALYSKCRARGPGGRNLKRIWEGERG